MYDAFTDYPFDDLGDDLLKEAPIRRIKILTYDRNKYCNVLVYYTDADGDARAYVTSIKSGYCYQNQVRLMDNDAKLFSYSDLCKLPWS